MKRFFISLCLLVSISKYSYASDYPKSKVEREMDEMGSIAGPDGLRFRPSLIKNTATKEKIGNVNRYLYQAAIDILSFAPLTSVDSNAGVVITDWYSPKGQKNTQFKINVFIKGDVISASTIEVNAYERNKVDGKWSEDYVDSPIGSIIEGKILRKARELYLKAQK